MDLGGILCGAGLVVAGGLVGCLVGFGFRDHLALFLDELLTWDRDA